MRLEYIQNGIELLKIRKAKATSPKELREIESRMEYYRKAAIAKGYNIDAFKAGDTITYNDGRPGHNAKGVVLAVGESGMTVQFEDRAEPSTIRFNERDWMQYITKTGDEGS
jgi:hypothetical protein